MRSQILPLILVSIAAVCGASASIFYKKASERIFEIPIYQNWPLFVGLALFTTVLFLFIAAFRFGGEYIFVYPAYATTYVWAMIFAVKFDNASVSKFQALGVFLIVLGVSFVGAGLKK